MPTESRKGPEFPGLLVEKPEDTRAFETTPELPDTQNRSLSDSESRTTCALPERASRRRDDTASADADANLAHSRRQPSESTDMD